MGGFWIQKPVSWVLWNRSDLGSSIRRQIEHYDTENARTWPLVTFLDYNSVQ
jgi:hypothetical protein